MKYPKVVAHIFMGGRRAPEVGVSVTVIARRHAMQKGEEVSITDTIHYRIYSTDQQCKQASRS